MSRRSVTDFVDYTPPPPADPIDHLRSILGRYGRAPLTPGFRRQVWCDIRQWAELHGQPMPGVFWYLPHGTDLFVGNVGPETFQAMTGRAPVDDDLDRINCKCAGEVGHIMCGWCDYHGDMRYRCGCPVGRELELG